MTPEPISYVRSNRGKGPIAFAKEVTTSSVNEGLTRKSKEEDAKEVLESDEFIEVLHKPFMIPISDQFQLKNLGSTNTNANPKQNITTNSNALYNPGMSDKTLNKTLEVEIFESNEKPNIILNLSEEIEHSGESDTESIIASGDTKIQVKDNLSRIVPENTKQNLDLMEAILPQKQRNESNIDISIDTTLSPTNSTFDMNKIDSSAGVEDNIEILDADSRIDHNSEKEDRLDDSNVAEYHSLAEPIESSVILYNKSSSSSKQSDTLIYTANQLSGSGMGENALISNLTHDKLLMEIDTFFSANKSSQVVSSKNESIPTNVIMKTNDLISPQYLVQSDQNQTHPSIDQESDWIVDIIPLEFLPSNEVTDSSNEHNKEQFDSSMDTVYKNTSSYRFVFPADNNNNRIDQGLVNYSSVNIDNWINDDHSSLNNFIEQVLVQESGLPRDCTAYIEKVKNILFFLLLINLRISI